VVKKEKFSDWWLGQRGSAEWLSKSPDLLVIIFAQVLANEHVNQCQPRNNKELALVTTKEFPGM
jgi:hypothetical protein